MIVISQVDQIGVNLGQFKFEFKSMSYNQSKYRKKQPERTRSPFNFTKPYDSKLLSKTLITKQNSDKIYFIENENEVLRMKNLEMAQTIQLLEKEHISEEQRAKQIELNCLNIQEQISIIKNTVDVPFNTEKQHIQKQLDELQHNILIWENKIQEVHKGIMYEQQNIPMLVAKNQQADVNLWKIKMENEGMKVIVDKLEKQIENLKKQSENLSKSKKYYGKEEQVFNRELELQKNQIKYGEKMRKQQCKKFGSILLYKILEQIYEQKLKANLILLRQKTIILRNNKKKIFALLNFHKSYIRFIKNKTLNKFKRVIDSTREETRTRSLLKNQNQTKQKGKIFGRWRKQFVKIQFQMVRKLQILTSFEKLQSSFVENLKIWCFNKIKYSKIRLKISFDSILKNLKNYRNRLMSDCLETLKKSSQSKYLNSQIQLNSKDQTEFLIKNMYFHHLLELTKANRVHSTALLFKYFKFLKKNATKKRKRALHSVISLIADKQYYNKTLIQTFAGFRYGTTKAIVQQAVEQKLQTTKQTRQLQAKLDKMNSSEGANFRALSLAKMGIILNRMKKKGFYAWRRWNRIRTTFKNLLEMFHDKRYNDMNMAFAKIQTRRFQKLKQSIAQKITSCEFSYNYLTQQNAHIKKVLDKKTLELQKTKFVKIVKNLINNQKSILDKYFKRLNKRSLKVLEVKNHTRNLQFLLNRKIKMVFFYYVKTAFEDTKFQNFFNRYIETLRFRYLKRLRSKCFKGLKLIKERNKKMKRILAFSYNRNVQLEIQKFFSLIKHIKQNLDFVNQSQQFTKSVERMKTITTQIAEKQETIAFLNEKLKDRKMHYRNRLSIALKIFYIKRIKIYVNTYINRWRKRTAKQLRFIKFSYFLQTKFRILFKERGLKNLLKFCEISKAEQINQKFKKFEHEYDQSVREYQQLSNTIDQKVKNMNNQNEAHLKHSQQYKKKLKRFDVVKLRVHAKKWGRKFAGIVLQKWKQRIESDRRILSKMQSRLVIIAERIFFQVFSASVVSEIIYKRIKKNLNKHYTNKYIDNINYFFGKWRNYAYEENKKVQDNKCAEIKSLANNTVQKTEKKLVEYQRLWTTSMIHYDLRSVFSKFSQYTLYKSRIHKTKARLVKSLRKQHASQAMMVMKTQYNLRLQKYTKFNYALEYRLKHILRSLLTTVRKQKARRSAFVKLFCGRLIHHYKFTNFKDGFQNIKLYCKLKQIHQLDIYTQKIQKVIETFNKRYKKTLGKALRTWRKSQFVKNIRRNLLTRILRKANNNRIIALFRSWKLETEARNVVYFSKTEGQVKKRQIEFQRTKKYIEQFKRSKGLLLENEQGNLVMSPRVLEKKQAQEKKQNSLRYKLISRLLLVSNGESAAIKAWNNLHLYYLIRRKYKKVVRNSLNHMRHPQTFQAFKHWHQILKEEKERFETMSRQDIIKVLQRHKDKIEIEYSKKLTNEQSMNVEMKRFEILESQSEKKERLCGFVFIRFLRNKLNSAFSKWRQQLNFEQDEDGNELQEQAYNHQQLLEKEFELIDRQYRQAMQINKQLKDTAMEGLQIAEAVRNLTVQRDQLNKELLNNQLTCQVLMEENIILMSKYNQATKQTEQLLGLTK